MMADYNMSTLRLFGWVLHKIFKQLYENVVVDSYIDYVIVPYIFFAYKL